ncbi:OLC1v1023645C1 [Oldenlandia corymbosa var. corymbosa]|uniref:OLC1v1023645C1 n=1 Tax=Oldenlandia corymbosa var. corymbosa TaxID=529605 RepID=A0AAV1C0G0_OLDCO|nr:OLC1v1023645C1 [Oldenlandia corymbosa var. corymbosa]
MNTLIPVSILVAFLVGAWSALKYFWLRPRKLEKILRAQGLVGSSYKPLLGDLIELQRVTEEAVSRPINLCDDILSRIAPFFLHATKKYGANPFVWYGPYPLVIIKDPELMKEMLQKHMIFQKPTVNPLARLLVEGVIIAEGDKWAKHRKIVNPAFHLEKIKLMLPAFQVCASEMVNKWEESLSPEGSYDLDVWPSLVTLTSDVISRTAFGSNYEEGRKIFELQEEQAKHIITIGLSLAIPGLRFLPTKRNRRMKEIARTVEELISNIIDKRVRAMEAGEPSKNDLLGILLDSNFQEIKEKGHKRFGLSTKDVVEECKLFYFAGQETTATLVVWSLVLLSQHPEWQSRAREEVFRVFGGTEINFDALNHLKVVTMILNETLRLYPSVAALSRTVIEDTRIGKYFLPAGTLFTLQIVQMHHDPEIWGDDVKEFKPERFSEGVANATKGQPAFFPFGSGPRICLGQNFSMTEAKLVMAMILQRFSFELSPSYTHAPYTVITVQPQHGAQLILRKL